MIGYSALRCLNHNRLTTDRLNIVSCYIGKSLIMTRVTGRRLVQLHRVNGETLGLSIRLTAQTFGQHLVRFGGGDEFANYEHSVSF